MKLKKLVSTEFRWTLVFIKENVFKVDFQRMEDLARLMVFGICRVLDSTCFLKFEEWSSLEPEGSTVA